MSDLISRKKLLEQIKADSEGQEGQYGDEWLFIDTINAIPTAEPKVGKWIPCEERMPQEYGKYLTTIESLLEEYSNGVDIIRYGEFTTPDDKEKVGWYFFDEWGEWEATHVIAWQPLLKPYEMERSE